VRQQLARDRGFTAGQRAALYAAIRDRFANYGFNVVKPEAPQDVQTLMHVVAEGMFDQAPPERIADVAYAAYTAVWRGAPAEVVDGIALYGFRKPVPADKLASWATGYRDAVTGGVPPEEGAVLVDAAPAPQRQERRRKPPAEPDPEHHAPQPPPPGLDPAQEVADQPPPPPDTELPPGPPRAQRGQGPFAEWPELERAALSYLG